ncbi:hypothetical protein J6590_068831 [Homalodisca vitripennis]|nr:hypothetical protein J6590_068831 [Homalodisca vitripennis]
MPKDNRPTYQRNAAPCQCVNRKDAVPSTDVNESLSVSEEIGRMATSYIPSDWRLFAYISISKGSGSIFEQNLFIWQN